MSAETITDAGPLDFLLGWQLAPGASGPANLDLALSTPNFANGRAEFLIAFAVLVGSITALLQLSRKSELTIMRAGGMLLQFLPKAPERRS